MLIFSQSAVVRPNSANTCCMRNRRVVLAPLVGFGDGFDFGGAERVAVFVIVNHNLHQLNDTGNLAGAKMADQFMRLRFERASGHGLLLVLRYCSAQERMRLKR